MRAPQFQRNLLSSEQSASHPQTPSAPWRPQQSTLYVSPPPLLLLLLASAPVAWSMQRSLHAKVLTKCSKLAHWCQPPWLD